jgi:YceI-like domain
MLRLFWCRQLSQLTLAAALVGVLPRSADAQAWTVDRKSSLAWYQVSPHFNQLWATTCPNEFSWRPGEGRSPGWTINPKLIAPKTGLSNVQDTIHVPFYPRPTALPVCREAVDGRVVLPDTATWRGVHGVVTVTADSLVTGENMRDVYARNLLGTAHFPLLQFTIDSLRDVTRPADTLFATAVGLLSVKGTDKPMTAVVRSWSEAGGIRVLARLRVPARVLWEDFGISKYALMGAGTGIWKDFFMGVDLLLRPEGTATVR